MNEGKETQICLEILNDAFWLSYLLEIKRKLTDYNTKEVLSNFLIFFGSIFCNETIAAKLGGMGDKAITTAKEIKDFRNANLKCCYTFTSNAARQIIEEMGVDLDHYVFDTVLTLNDSNLLDVNFRSWNYDKEDNQHLLECVIATPNAWMEKLMPDLFESILEVLKEHTDKLIDGLSYTHIEKKSYATYKLFLNSTLGSDDKIYILHRYGLIQVVNFVDNFLKEDISVHYNNLVLSSSVFLMKCKAVLIEMFYHDSKNNPNLKILENIFQRNKESIPPEFYAKNRSVRDNLHYCDYHYLSDDEIYFVQKYQGVYLSNVLAAFDQNITCSFGLSYKIALGLAKVYRWSSE